MGGIGCARDRRNIPNENAKEDILGMSAKRRADESRIHAGSRAAYAMGSRSGANQWGNGMYSLAVDAMGGGTRPNQGRKGVDRRAVNRVDANGITNNGIANGRNRTGDRHVRGCGGACQLISDAGHRATNSMDGRSSTCQRRYRTGNSPDCRHMQCAGEARDLILNGVRCAANAMQG